MIDVGSTTTDVIPLLNVRPIPVGVTDTERLQSGELQRKAGVRRTPVCALGPTLPYRGRDTGLAGVWFATRLVVFLTVGLAHDYLEGHCGTPPIGAPATRPSASRTGYLVITGADWKGFSDSRTLALGKGRGGFDRCLGVISSRKGAAVRGRCLGIGRVPAASDRCGTDGAGGPDV